VAAIELLLVLPILLIVVFACIEMSMLVVAEQRLAEASREGARVAALGGGYDDVVECVRTTLGGGRFADVEVVAPQLADDHGRPLPAHELPASGTPLVVITKVKSRDVVPGFLNLGGEILAARTIMRKE
jgi:hypothetical protein